MSAVAQGALRTFMPDDDAGPHGGLCDLELELVGDLAGFEALESQWNALFGRAGESHQLFQTFNWNWHWCRTYLDTASNHKYLAPNIVVGRSGGRVVMIWPLVADRKIGLNQVCWMGNPVSQYGDVLVEDGPARLAWLRQGWRFICDELGLDVVCMPRVRADAALTELLAEDGPKPVAETMAPYVDLTGVDGYDAYTTRLAARVRKDNRRKWRRLREQGTVSVSVLRGDADARAAVRRAIDFKRRWLKSRGLPSRAFADRRIDRFFEAVTTSRRRPVGCEVVVLEVGGKTVAIEVGIVCQGRHANHICSYDPDPRFARCSAGALVMEEAVRSCLDKGLTCYDLMGPGDAYKVRRSDGAVALRDYAVGLTSVGRLYLAVGGNVHDGMRSAFAAMPLGVRQVTAPILSRLG